MSLETPSNFSSSETSDEFDEDELFFIEDESFRDETPSPTFDTFEFNQTRSKAVEYGMPLITLTPDPDSPRRPDTSTSSIFSFNVEMTGTPPPAEALQLPTFVVPDNSSFLGWESEAEINVYAQFDEWIYSCSPRGTFASVSAEEIEKNPRDARSVPSLFKQREHGCGYCRSTGVPRWETHTRQNCYQLRALAPCKICGAAGEINHTETYCPMKPSVALSLEEKFARISENGNFERSRNHFHKYSELLHLIYPSSD